MNYLRRKNSPTVLNNQKEQCVPRQLLLRYTLLLVIRIFNKRLSFIRIEVFYRKIITGFWNYDSKHSRIGSAIGNALLNRNERFLLRSSIRENSGQMIAFYRGMW